MSVYVALLRAVNVGGTGKLPMKELAALCEGLGFEGVRTYIQSGNVVFRAPLPAKKAKRALEEVLTPRLAKPARVILRTGAEMRQVAAANPYPAAAPNRVVVVFLDEAVESSALTGVETPGGEQLTARGREIYVHFPDGQGRSKLKLPQAPRGTGRNLNTVRRLVAMAEELAASGA